MTDKTRDQGDPTSFTGITTKLPDSRRRNWRRSGVGKYSGGDTTVTETSCTGMGEEGGDSGQKGCFAARLPFLASDILDFSLAYFHCVQCICYADFVSMSIELHAGGSGG